MLKKFEPSLLFWLGGPAVGLLLIFGIGAASGLSMYPFGMSAALFAIFVYFTAAHYDRQLQGRIADPQPWIWQVSVNGVSIGAITDADYAAILRTVLRDGNMALDHLVSSLKWTIALAVKMLFVFPVVVFWLLALLAMIIPDEAMPFLTNLYVEWNEHAMKSVMLTNIVGMIGMLSVFLAFLSMPARSLSSYKQSTGRLLRLHFNTPADGDVYVSRFPEGCGDAIGK
ncbi:hypothetical protein IPU70_15540 [Achromobacter sp. SD115]|jgi:hypothetical protein|uniref:hypothetical protein n=1 Tax=Achromobacter TaxID=222 RepID=UPI001A965CFE|nr:MULTISPECIES: hypothetical protein [Achromobacter]MBO1014973.1 hypothetical protein [Achromobacter sp. SD115]